MKLRKIQVHPASNAIIKAEVKKLNFTYYSVTNAVIIPLHPTKGGQVSSKAPEWFQEWSNQIFTPFVKEMKEFKTKQEAFNGEVTTFIKEQKTFNEKVDVRLEKIENRLDSLEYKVDAILECPTIKKEIKL